MDADLSTGSDHTSYAGFPIPHHDRISLFHRLTRTRVGVALFVVLVLGFSIVPSTIYPITFLFIISTGLVKQSMMRKLSDYIPGCWIYSVAVSNTAQYCILYSYYNDYIPYYIGALLDQVWNG